MDSKQARMILNRIFEASKQAPLPANVHSELFQGAKALDEFLAPKEPAPKAKKGKK